MATSKDQDGKEVSVTDVDVLLHPELLSQDFLQLILNEKQVSTRDCGSRDRLKELYIRHVIPLPQRTLPNNRWGKRVAKSRGRPTPAGPRSQRLKPPPAVNLSNPIRRLPGNTPSSSSTQGAAHGTDTLTLNLKREADTSGVLKSPDAKRKIQHVKWP